MKRYVSLKISYILVAFFLGTLLMFICSVAGAVHAVNTAAEKIEVLPTVVLDAGHGGEDGGAVSADGVEEKTLNLAIALALREKLAANGFSVRMIRETDTAVGDTSLDTVAARKRSDIHSRVDLVDQTDHCILVSIHQNYFEQSRYSGAQVFYSPNTPESASLAEQIRLKIVEKIQPENKRENKPAEKGIYLLQHVSVPAVIVECGFLSNPEEAALLQDPEYQSRFAAAVAEGIAVFCGKEPDPGPVPGFRESLGLA